MRNPLLERHSEYHFDHFGGVELLQIPVPDRLWRRPPGLETYEDFRGLEGRRPGHSRSCGSMQRV